MQRALDAIAAAERQVAAMPPSALTLDYLADIERVMALPENQSGADKSWVWPRYEAIRRRFAELGLTPQDQLVRADDPVVRQRSPEDAE